MLQPERREREAEQHDRQHGGAALVVRGADDGEEDLRRQHLEIAAEHERVAEIRQALDEAEQEGVGEARPHQRQRDGAERRPALARSVCDASSSEGLMPCTTPISTRKAIGVKASSCAMRTPGRP